MTDRLPPRPEEAPAPRPFDESGRLVGARRPRTALTDGDPADGTTPPTATGGLPVPGAYGGRPLDGPAPLNWTRTGSVPLGPFSGTMTLTGGLVLGRSRRKRQTVSGFDPVVRGRGLARLSRRPQPTTASEMQRATVRWITALWVLVLLLQRFAVPGQPVAILIPVILVWCVYGLFRGVLELHRHNTGFWLAVAGVSALTVPVQNALVPTARVSMTAWGLLLVTWMVFLFRLRDRRRSTYLACLRGIFKVSLWESAVVIAFMALQLVVPYRDLVADYVPSNLLMNGFTLAYPFSYGSPWYRSNGWLGLETSFVSMQLAIGVLAALLLRRKLPWLLIQLAAIACTGAQSGVQIIGIAVAVMLFSPMRWALARYLVMVPTIIAFLISPLGANTITRLTEGSSAKTSTGTRSIVPYQILVPQWIKQPKWVAFGAGPGSSQEAITQSHVTGALVTTPLKLFYDYGVIAGLALAICLMFMFLGGPSRSMAIGLATSYWAFQPLPTMIILLVTVAMFISWWTPRTYPQFESEYVPSPNAALPGAARNRRPATVP